MIRPSRLILALAMALAMAPAVTPQGRRPAPPPAPEPAPPPPDDIRVRSELNQTAAWIGDPLAFVVEIETAPGVEVVAEDLAPEKLVVEGLELGPATVIDEPRADGWLLRRHQYRIVAWDTAEPKRVGEFVVRFRRPVTTATATGAAPGAEITIPGATLAVRSTLPDDGSADGARDRRAPLAPPGWVAWLRPIGLGLVLLGVAPVVLWLAAFVRRPRTARHRPSSRSLHAHVKALFDELAIIDTDSADGRRRAYDRMDADLRSYLSESEGVPAAALTADELRPRLSQSKRVQGDLVCDILAECEHARYAPMERLPGAEAVRASIDRLRAALSR